MTKNYIQPTIEVMTVHSMDTICTTSGTSGGGNSVSISSQSFDEENLIF